MKSIIFCLLICLSFVSSYSQSNLEIFIESCKHTRTMGRLDEFKLYRNDTFLRNVETDYRSLIKLKNLTYGKYKIEYKTIFQKTENVEIELSKEKKYKLELCLDYIDYDSETYEPIINQLKNGESYSIYFYSVGCFHFEYDTLVIRKDDDNFFAHHKNKIKQLDTNDINELRHFEIELNYMETSGCTTNDHYTLQYKRKKIEISDGSCSWLGFSFLLEKLDLSDRQNE